MITNHPQNIKDPAHRYRWVLTNGCFDLLHQGHIECLQMAKDLGTKLVVLVDDDDAVRATKGPTRPIQTVIQRAKAIASLRLADYIIPVRHMATAMMLVPRIDIYVKGDDRSYDTLDERERKVLDGKGASFVFVRSSTTTHTTDIIERIKNNA